MYTTMYTTLHATLDKIAANHPDVAAEFPGEKTSLRLDNLSRDSAYMAAGLRDAGIVAGDRVGVLSANEPDFLLALFALSRLGAVACPLPLPTTARDGYPTKIQGILAAGRIRHVVVSRRLSRMRGLVAGALGDAGQTGTADLLGRGGLTPVTGAELSADNEIIVQFTSGSTAQPKGVRLTHANVQACLQAIRMGLDMRREDRLGIWLPLFHDMGLFGTLTPLLIATPVTVWPSTAFVKDPATWLREFADGGYTIAPMPNFAFDYLLRSVPPDEVASYDLSRWKAAVNGAEPITVDSVDAFIDHFAAAGFRGEAMMPVYGLAEAVLAVTFPPLLRAPGKDWVDRARLAEEGVAVPADRDAPGSRGLVSLGGPLADMNVRIADPDTAQVRDERLVGEIQLYGAAVTGGYVNENGAVAQPFTEDGWLRTGDLGYLADGELYITGRIKEMIIVRGTNFYPDDVESAVRADPDVYRRRCVAYADEVDGRERMVLVAETTVDGDEQAELVDRLRTLVGGSVEIDDLKVVLAGPNAIPRTSSGKLQRIAARERFR